MDDSFSNLKKGKMIFMSYFFRLHLENMKKLVLSRVKYVLIIEVVSQNKPSKIMKL